MEAVMKKLLMVACFILGMAVATAVPFLTKGCGPWLDNLGYEVYVVKQKMLGEPYYIRKCG